MNEGPLERGKFKCPTFHILPSNKINIGKFKLNLHKRNDISITQRKKIPLIAKGA